MYCRILFLTLLVAASACSDKPEPISDGRVNDYSALISEYEDPGVDYRPAPLWVWNNEVSREDIDLSLAELKKQGIGGVYIHPRKGLVTEYLSDEWFELVAYSMEKAKEIGLNVWIYDENVCPSGFAGGHVFNEMPESYNQGTSLTFRKMKRLDLSASELQSVKFVYKKVGETWVNITDQSKQEEGKEGAYAVSYLRNFAVNYSSYAGFSYVDLIAKGVTEKFMEVTMEGYEKVGGDEFGKLIPGIFTDEPQIGSEGGIRYTPDLFDEFRKRWGYNLEDELMSLSEETGDWKKTRHDYRSVLLEMFINRWAKPWYEYTEERDLIWTGHYWENTWPDIYHGPDNMAMYAWHQMPGIDMLGNTLEKRPDQFGNNITVKEVSSIANQFERHRTLSESYGGAGWDLRFEDMKRLGDWEYALGVNFLNQHISQLSLVGYRKQNYPQSFLNYDPYWDLYKNQMDYFARLSLALSSGRQINKTLLLEPTTSVWMYYGGGTDQKLNEIGNSFKGMINFLEDQQAEYDLGCENVIKDHGRVSGTNFIINKRAYDLVVIPDGMENLDQASFDLLQEYVANGGTLLQIGSAPGLIDGAESEALSELTKSGNWINHASLNEQLVKEYILRDDFQMTPSATGRVHHMRRQLKDGQVLFVSNFSLEEEASTRVTVEGASLESICPQTGIVSPVYYEKKGDKITFPVHLFPGGSTMLYVHNKKTVAPADKAVKHEKNLVASPESKVDQLHPNVLNIDYVSLNLMGEKKGALYYARASDLIYKRFGYERGSPWDMVQYKTLFLDQNKLHKEGERFELSYLFNTATGTDTRNMKLVVEQASFYNISINGQEVKAGNETWLDPDFNCIEIEKYVKTGKNVVKLSMNHFDNRCDPSPVYILGNFSLESAEKGWNMIPSGGITTGSWKNQGLPFYSESVRYTKEISIKNDGDYEIELPEWNGTVAEVLVNGNSVGVIQSQPYTKMIELESGNNEVSVVVYASLKNVFGPHHVYARGFMRPPAFRKGKEIMPPGIEYDFLDYGLFEDFEIYALKE
ncbi:MAG: hypothetical protein GY790_00275 [Bacteroidetes bacterium]|nr:hypothetical protein [Bacteroidota bacterium]